MNNYERDDDDLVGVLTIGKVRNLAKKIPGTQKALNELFPEAFLEQKEEFMVGDIVKLINTTVYSTPQLFGGSLGIVLGLGEPWPGFERPFWVHLFTGATQGQHLVSPHHLAHVLRPIITCSPK